MKRKVRSDFEIHIYEFRDTCNDPEAPAGIFNHHKWTERPREPRLLARDGFHEIRHCGDHDEQTGRQGRQSLM